MEYVVLGIHLFICLGLIGLVLLQRSEGGALGMGGGGAGSLMSGRGAADALAKMTTFAGGFFLITSFVLTFISGASQTNSNRSIFDSLPAAEAPATLPESAPEPARPDPTQSSVEDDAQLASTGASIEIAPPPAAASTRAGPVSAAPRTTTAAPTQNPPARTQPAAATTRPPATTTTQRPTTTTQRPATTTQPATTTTTTSPALPGVVEVPPEQLAPESGEAGDGITTPIRRERAGPDQ